MSANSDLFQYVPADVVSISLARPSVVTTSSNHNFQTGFGVRFQIPLTWGMPQLGNKIYGIKVLSDTTFALYESLTPELPVDSRLFQAFTNPNNGTIAQVNPCCELSYQFKNIIWQNATIYCDSPLNNATANIRNQN